MIFNTGTSRSIVFWTAVILLVCSANHCRAEKQSPKWPDHIQVVLDSTMPLEYDRGRRLPLYLWQVMDPGPLDEDSAEVLVKALDERGVGLVTSWNPGNREKSLVESLKIAAAQKKLSLRVNINATSCMDSFFNGDPRMAHIDDEGKPFWDTSFGEKNMGCPLSIEIAVGNGKFKVAVAPRQCQIISLR